METSNKNKRSLSAMGALAMANLMIFMTHLVQPLAAEKEWFWWAWTSALCLTALIATATYLREQLSAR